MSILDNLPAKCRIDKKQRVADSLGGSRSPLDLVATGVECWEQQFSNKETQDFKQRGFDITTRVYFTTDPQLTSQHQITITERNGVAVSDPGSVYDVVSKCHPDAYAGFQGLFKYFCRIRTAIKDNA